MLLKLGVIGIGISPLHCYVIRDILTAALFLSQQLYWKSPGAGKMKL